jgi:hexosaminidase
MSNTRSQIHRKRIRMRIHGRGNMMNWERLALLLIVMSCFTMHRALGSIPAKCDGQSVGTEKASPTVIPSPQTVTFTSGNFAVPQRLICYTNSRALRTLSDILNNEFHLLTAGEIVASSYRPETSALLFLILDASLDKDSYRLVIDSRVRIMGGSYQAVAMGSVTFLQMLRRQADGTFVVPRVMISDSPAIPFRALMIDLARNWHDVATLERLIGLARWYKINYVQLHLTDNELFTFPTSAFPELPTPGKHYTKAQLRGLVEYARARGVALIPELDVPGHERPMVERRLDLFGFSPEIKDAKGRTLSTINMGRESAYAALDKLVGEVADIFYTSSYIHMGGDEADLEPLTAEAEVQRYMSKHGLGNVEELYRHFLVRMNQIVKRYGRQMIVWEGFRKEGQVEIARDVIVMEFETLYQLPQDLLAGGYKVINTSWKPLYVVNEKKWEPEYVYNNWNPYRWENWWSRAPSYTPIQLEPTPQVIGAMMCAWDQTQETELSSLRKRLAAMSERAWHGGLQPERPYSWFEGALAHTDASLEAVVGNSK